MADNQLDIEMPANPREHIGANLPPLAEQLAEEAAPLRDRSRALTEVAKTALIVDEESASKIVNLVSMARAIEKEAKEAHDARKAPFLEAGRAVDAAYNEITGPMAQIVTTLRRMLTEFENKREAKARAEREKAEAEQRARQEEADRLAREAQEKASVGAQLDAMQAQEKADAAARRAEAIRPAPLRSALGQVATVRQKAVKITDLRKLLGWMIKQPMKGGIEAEALRMMQAYVRANVEFDAIEAGKVAIPGVEITIERSASVRR